MSPSTEIRRMAGSLGQVAPGLAFHIANVSVLFDMAAAAFFPSCDRREILEANIFSIFEKL